MNVSEMIDELASRLEDLGKSVFTDSFKLLTLNNAQDKLANLLVNEYLTELEVKESIAHSDGAIQLDGSGANSTTNKVLRGSEGVLLAAQNSDGVFATRLALRDLKKKENTFYAASAQNPLYYIFQNTVYVAPTAEATWDLYYLKQPTALLYKVNISALGTPAKTGFTGDASQGLVEADEYYGGVLGQQSDSVIYCIGQGTYHIVTNYVGATRTFTVAPDAPANFGDDEIYFVSHDFDLTTLTGVSCELNEALHELVVDFAEAECWKMANKLDRSKSALEMALLNVKNLNDKYLVESGMGIGSRQPK